MNEKNKAKFKKFLTGAAVFATSCALVFAPACSTTDDGEDEDENTSTKLDTQLIKNGNFEFYDDNDGTYFISSPDNWSLGTTGNSSNSMSGVIDVSKSGWDKLTDPTLPETLENNDDLEDDDEDKVDYNGALTDDLPFANPHDATSSDAATDNYEYIENPFTHEYSYDEDGNVLNAAGEKVTTYTDEDGNVYLDEELTNPLETSVLMLHNYRKSYYTGTETYCQSSSTITLEASTAAAISVWVKTSDLYFDGATNESVVLREGKIARALTASSAIPPFFRGVDWEEKKLYDGAFSNAVPADLVRGMGAEYVVGIDLSAVKREKKSIIGEWLAKMPFEYGNTSEKGYRDSDIMLKPPLSQYSAASFAGLHEMYEIGYETAMKEMPAIKEGIAARKKKECANGRRKEKKQS